METWNGTSWTTSYNLPNPPGSEEGDLTTISATSASNMWVVGT